MKKYYFFDPLISQISPFRSFNCILGYEKPFKLKIKGKYDKIRGWKMALKGGENEKNTNNNRIYQIRPIIKMG